MRGHTAELGATRISPNGYHYTRTKEGWRLTHHLAAEKMLGRRLEPGERVHFKDKTPQGRLNFSPNNLVVVTEGNSKVRQKITKIDARILDLQKEREYLLNQLSPEERAQFQ